MKKKLIISPLIAALIYTSCGIGENKNTENEQTTTINNTSIPNFNKSFEGTINGKYEIIMSLSKNKENLNGTYAYKSKGNLINITGTIDDNGNLTINEFNDKGNMTGVFIGQLSGNSISGKWTKPDGTKPMLFSISESINNEINVNKTRSENSNEYSNWSGIYFDEFGRSLKISGPSSDGAVKFELSPQNNENCQEGIWNGTAYLTSSAVANYTEDGSECHFNFTFNPGQIEVHEYNCSHGIACGTFDGFYSKKN